MKWWCWVAFKDDGVDNDEYKPIDGDGRKQ